MLDWVFGNKKSKVSAHKAPPYEDAREQAENGTADERIRLAKCEDLSPEFLYYFATDKDLDVRKAVASNFGTPLQADVILAQDRDVTVRSILAKKIAVLLPDIRVDQSEKLASLVFEVLDVLAKDQAVQVRQIVAESIKSLDNVPKPIIQLLARDLNDVVSTPVLEFSPLLDDTDLLNLIISGISGMKLAAVSRRQDLTLELIDAIVDTKDEIGITALIGNEKANIPDKTLSEIADASETIEAWQSALAVRSRIPQETLKKLAHFATSSVLERLKQRSDLGAELYDELATAIERQSLIQTDEPLAVAALNKAAQMHHEQKLSEQYVLASVDSGDRIFVAAALATLSEIDFKTVQSVLSQSNIKSLLALVWKAGMSMQLAMALQKKIMMVPASKIIQPGTDGEFPLSAKDLSWQWELLEST